MTILAVTTTQRPVDYLQQTISYLEKAGACRLPMDQKVLHADGPIDWTPAGWTILQTPVAVGSRKAFWKLIELAHERNENLIGVEDDIVCSRNAVDLMLDFQVPDDCAFVSFFDNVTQEGAVPELRHYPLDGPLQFWGVQAIKIPADRLPVLLEGEKSKIVNPRTADGRLHQRDTVLQICFADSKWPYWATLFPHIVQHVGDVSVVKSTRAVRMEAQGLKRDSKNYAGDDFDALSLRS